MSAFLALRPSLTCHANNQASQAYPLNVLAVVGFSARLAVYTNGGDLLYTLGGADVVTSEAGGTLLPAGASEIVALGGATYIAVLSHNADATALNVTIGNGG